MSTRIFDGNALARHILSDLKEKIVQGRKTPTLGIILVGDNPSSLAYIKRKEEAAAFIGARVLLKQFPKHTQAQEISAVIESWNRDPHVNGIIIQLPLPGHLPGVKIEERVDPNKDVDGLVPGSPFIPATAKGVELIIAHEGIEVAGKHAVVVGRSKLVGLPLAHLLLRRNATVTICHAKTNNLSYHTKQADILVSATGHADLITAADIKPGAVIFNIGITRDESEGVKGDVSTDVIEKASFYTPVPGGIGPLTVAALLLNLVTSSEAAP